MALSGSLDTFELPDVLRLLASTSKTGRLRITGDRGSGSVWTETGKVVATELTGPAVGETSDEQALFGMLRFKAGSFTFESEATVSTAGEPRSLEPVLGAAENMMIEWRAIESVVPSLDIWVALRGELDGPDVMIDADRWRTIATIGSGNTVATVATTHELDEIGACRTVKELIELGLVAVIDAPDEISTPRPVETVADHVSEEPASSAWDEDLSDPVADDIAAEAPVALDPLLDDSVADDRVAMHEMNGAVESDADHGAPNGHEFEVDPLAPSESSTVPGLASLGEENGIGGEELPVRGATGLEDLAEPEPVAVSAPAEFFSESADFAGDELDPAEMARQLANLSPKAAKAVAAAAKASTAAERDAALAAVEAEDDTVNRGLLLKFLGSVDS